MNIRLIFLISLRLDINTYLSLEPIDISQK